jgi:hypothetical protein
VTRHAVVNALAFWRRILGQEEAGRSCIENSEKVEDVPNVSDDCSDDRDASDETANDGDDLGGCCGGGDESDEQGDEDGLGTHFTWLVGALKEAWRRVFLNRKKNREHAVFRREAFDVYWQKDKVNWRDFSSLKTWRRGRS